MATSKSLLKGPRVLYLHELEAAPGNEKQRLLEKAIGKQRVKAPNLKTRQGIVTFALAYLALFVCLVTATIAAAVLAPWYATLSILIVSLLLLAIGYWPGGRGVTQYMVLKAVKLAEKKFKEQRPNVIVGSSFGAVVALSMDVPKVPLLLLSPAHEQYTRFMHLRSSFKLSPYPYVMLIHGSADKTVPLDDSIKLVETSEVGRCRLEVIDDGHALSSITTEDMRSWVEEVYATGKNQVFKMSKEGSKDVDPSLFDADDEISLPSQHNDPKEGATVTPTAENV